MGAIELSEGSLTKRPYKGGLRWYGQIRYKSEDGKKWQTKKKALTDEAGNAIMTDPDRKRRDGTTQRTTRNIRAANAALARWRESLAGSVYDRNATVKAYVKNDIKARKGAIAGSTARGYAEYVPIIANGLEGVTMAQLDAKAVREWVRHMKERGLSPNTMRKAYNLLAQTCERAMENGDISSNPCTARIRREDLPSTGGRQPNALDSKGVARVNALLDAADNPRLRIGARLALACGLRQGEVCGLRWRDVDGGILHVRECVADVGGGTVVKSPKSAAGKRDVPIPRALARELAEWREVQHAEWEKAARGQEEEVVAFADCRVIGYADGNHYTPHALGRLWRKLAKGKHDRDPNDRRKRGEGWEPGRKPIKGTQGTVVTFHDLRHTYATQAIAAGADVRSVAALMGHADVSMTLNTYADAAPEAKLAAQRKAAPVLEMGSRYALRAV